jgi:hypothetical protein
MESLKKMALMNAIAVMVLALSYLENNQLILRPSPHQNLNLLILSLPILVQVIIWLKMKNVVQMAAARMADADGRQFSQRF